MSCAEPVECENSYLIAPVLPLGPFTPDFACGSGADLIIALLTTAVVVPLVGTLISAVSKRNLLSRIGTGVPRWLELRPVSIGEFLVGDVYIALYLATFFS